MKLRKWNEKLWKLVNILKNLVEIQENYVNSVEILENVMKINCNSRKLVKIDENFKKFSGNSRKSWHSVEIWEKKLWKWIGNLRKLVKTDEFF